MPWEPGNSETRLRTVLQEYLTFWLNHTYYKGQVPKCRYYIKREGDRQPTGTNIVIASGKDQTRVLSFMTRLPSGKNRPTMEETHVLTIFVKSDQRNGGLEIVENMAAVVKSIMTAPVGTEEYQDLRTRGIFNAAVTDEGIQVDPDQTGGRLINAHRINDIEGVFFTEVISLVCTTDTFNR